MSVTSTTQIPDDGENNKEALLCLLMSTNCLSFGSYMLKSGRQSPYFFTSSLLHTAPQLHATAMAFANVLSNPPFVTTSAYNTTRQPIFDIIFGPAYKGIPLCAAVVNELAARDKLSSSQRMWEHVSYSFNRKEIKAHGEGGVIVGAPLEGKRVLILDDVMSAGTAMRQALGIIKDNGGSVAGVLVLLDREERLSDTESKSAVGVAQRELGENVPVRAVLGLHDLIDKLQDKIGKDEIQRLEDYRERYKAE